MEVANLYDNGPISPICQVKEHLAVWGGQAYLPYQAEYIEPVPRSSAFIVDLVAVSGAVAIAAGATIAGQIIQILRMNQNELLHVRWFVIDDVEGQLWQLSNMARFAPRGAQAGVNLLTPQYDPWLATTTFWVLGTVGDRDAMIGCTNLTGAALPQARLGFFGYRYILGPENQIHPNARYLPGVGR